MAFPGHLYVGRLRKILRLPIRRILATALSAWSSIRRTSASVKRFSTQYHHHRLLCLHDYYLVSLPNRQLISNWLFMLFLYSDIQGDIVQICVLHVCLHINFVVSSSMSSSPATSSWVLKWWRVLVLGPNVLSYSKAHMGRCRAYTSANTHTNLCLITFVNAERPISLICSFSHIGNCHKTVTTISTRVSWVGQSTTLRPWMTN